MFQLQQVQGFLMNSLWTFCQNTINISHDCYRYITELVHECYLMHYLVSVI